MARQTKSLSKADWSAFKQQFPLFIAGLLLYGSAAWFLFANPIGIYSGISPVVQSILWPVLQLKILPLLLVGLGLASEEASLLVAVIVAGYMGLILIVIAFRRARKSSVPLSWVQIAIVILVSLILIHTPQLLSKQEEDSQVSEFATRYVDGVINIMENATVTEYGGAYPKTENPQRIGTLDSTDGSTTYMISSRFVDLSLRMNPDGMRFEPSLFYTSDGNHFCLYAEANHAKSISRANVTTDSCTVGNRKGDKSGYWVVGEGNFNN